MKACGLHMVAEENALRWNSDSSPELGEMWRYGCTKSPLWSSNEWAGSEGASSLESYEHKVGHLAIEVVGHNWSSEVISLFLEDWEVGRVAFGCHLSMDLLCQETRNACGESLGSPRSLCSECQEREGGGVLMPRFLLSNVVRATKEKERERRTLLSCVGLPVSFHFLTQFEHGVPLERGCLVLSFVPPCCVNSSEG